MPLSYIKASSISLNNPDIKHMLPYISLYISCPQYHLEAKYITVDLVSCCWEGQMVVSATNTNIYLPGSAMRPASGRSDINKSRWVGGGEVQWFQWLGLAVCYHLHSLSNQSRVNQTCYVTYADVITVFFFKGKEWKLLLSGQKSMIVSRYGQMAPFHCLSLKWWLKVVI